MGKDRQDLNSLSDTTTCILIPIPNLVIFPKFHSLQLYSLLTSINRPQLDSERKAKDHMLKGYLPLERQIPVGQHVCPPYKSRHSINSRLPQMDWQVRTAVGSNKGWDLDGAQSWNAGV